MALFGRRREVEAPLEDDPLAGAFPLRRGLPAFIFSAAFHAAVLVLLTTISFAVVHREERINVTLAQPPAAPEGDQDLEGAPSLKDLVGVLAPQHVATKSAGSVAGPSASQAVAAPAPVREPAMPRIAGIGPSVGAIGTTPGTLDIP